MIQTLFGSVEQEPTLLDRLKAGISKTRAGLTDRLEDAFSGRREIDADLLDELEYALITADIGVRTTTEVLEQIRLRVDRKLLGDAGELKSLIKQHLLEVSRGERTSRAACIGAACRCHGGGCEWGREDDDYRKACSTLQR